MLVDQVRIKVKAGDGGPGLIHFKRLPFRRYGSPDGGNGGQGGSIYFVGSPDISLLRNFHSGKKYQAQNGFPGGPNQKTGKNGKDLIFSVPVGTTVYYDNGTSVDINQIGQKVLIAKGGAGGKGNFYYRSSTNRSPSQAQSGQTTIVKKLRLDLKLIAQVGLVGLPNAGKTSLLNCLTRAHAKVAAYPFTTLEPNLGVLPSGKIIADIPGLIEGASQGRGLGDKFLKHISRTQTLIHCLSAESANPVKDYQTIRRELESYSLKLTQKTEILLITKSDLLVSQKPFLRLKPKLFVSIHQPSTIHQLHQLLSRL